VPRDRNEIVVLWWRDLPAQVNAQQGRTRHQVLLPAQFQRAIDRARRKGKVDTAHDEVDQWRREAKPLAGDPRGAAEAEAARLRDAYSIERLGRIAFNAGWEAPDGHGASASASDLDALEGLDS
jgi:hypothetical protein